MQNLNTVTKKMTSPQPCTVIGRFGRKKTQIEVKLTSYGMTFFTHLEGQWKEGASFFNFSMLANLSVANRCIHERFKKIWALLVVPRAVQIPIEIFFPVNAGEAEQRACDRLAEIFDEIARAKKSNISYPSNYLSSCYSSIGNPEEFVANDVSRILKEEASKMIKRAVDHRCGWLLNALEVRGTRRSHDEYRRTDYAGDTAFKCAAWSLQALNLFDFELAIGSCSGVWGRTVLMDLIDEKRIGCARRVLKFLKNKLLQKEEPSELRREKIKKYIMIQSRGQTAFDILCHRMGEEFQEKIIRRVTFRKGAHSDPMKYESMKLYLKVRNKLLFYFSKGERMQMEVRWKDIQIAEWNKFNPYEMRDFSFESRLKYSKSK